MGRNVFIRRLLRSAVQMQHLRVQLHRTGKLSKSHGRQQISEESSDLHAAGHFRVSIFILFTFVFSLFLVFSNPSKTSFINMLSPRLLVSLRDPRSPPGARFWSLPGRRVSRSRFPSFLTGCTVSSTSLPHKLRSSNWNAVSFWCAAASCRAPSTFRRPGVESPPYVSSSPAWRTCLLITVFKLIYFLFDDL